MGKIKSKTPIKIEILYLFFSEMNFSFNYALKNAEHVIPKWKKNQLFNFDMLSQRNSLKNRYYALISLKTDSLFNFLLKDTHSISYIQTFVFFRKCQVFRLRIFQYILPSILVILMNKVRMLILESEPYFIACLFQ